MPCQALYKRPKLSISLAANYISPTIKLLLAEVLGFGCFPVR